MRPAHALLVALLTPAVVACGSSDGMGGFDGNNPREAQAQCEHFASQELKAPATADYDLEATFEDGSTWSVAGTVDAENGFGAQIRSAVTCRVQITSTGAKLLALEIT